MCTSVFYLRQWPIAVKSLGLVGSANFRGVRVFESFAHHAADSVGDVSEARVWRLGPSQQDVLAAVAAAPTGHAPSTWPLATLAQRRSRVRGTPRCGAPRRASRVPRAAQGRCAQRPQPPRRTPIAMTGAAMLRRPPHRQCRAAAKVTPSVEATRGPSAQAAEPAHDGDLATAHAPETRPASPRTVLLSRRRAQARTRTSVDARKLALTHAEAGHLELLRGGEAGDARADHNRMLLRAPAHPTATNTAQPFSHGAARCTRVPCALACALRAAHCAHRVGSFIRC